MPEINITTVVIAGHLVGLCLGLGGAVLMDAIIFRFFHQQKVTQDQVDVFSFMSKLVTLGLVILWLTGLGFLAIYLLQEPAKLANPKIWGKVSIVVVLTLNGVLLHYKILPLVKSLVGFRLFERTNRRQNWLMISTGCVSVVSWFLPFFLGVSKELNFAVTISEILSVYGIALLVIGGSASIIFRQFLWHKTKKSSVNASLAR